MPPGTFPCPAAPFCGMPLLTTAVRPSATTAQAPARRLRGLATWRRLLALVGLLAGLGVLGASPAAAHAVLESTSPFDGESLDQAPGEVLLVFNEPVGAPQGAVRVFDSTGERVDAGDADNGERPPTLRVGLPAGLADDTYVVTWRAISADSHPVKGAFLFTVGAGDGADADALLAQVFSGDGDRPYAVAAAAARWVHYAASLLAAGGMVFLVRVHDPRAAERGLLERIVGRAAAVALAATVAGVFLQAALVTGLGVAAFARPEALAATMTSSFGLASVVAVLGLAVILVGLRRRPGRLATVGLAGAAVLVGSFLLTGHTMTSEPRWLVMAADAAHTAAAAAWFGGLVLLAVALRRRRLVDDPLGAAGMVARFSALATVALVAVSVAGVTLAWVEVRALRALFSTTYGWTLVAKVVLFAAVLALGAYNHRRLVPAIARAGGMNLARAGRHRLPVPAGGSTAAARPVTEDSVRAWRLLRRTVRLEVAGLLAVIAATAVLVNLQPAASAAGITGAYSTYAPISEDYQVSLTVDPNRAGLNQVHVYLLDTTGRPVDDAEELTLRLSQPERDIGPLERTPSPAGPGHWTLTGPELSLPGPWVIEVVARISKFEQLSTEIPVFVGG